MKYIIIILLSILANSLSAQTIWNEFISDNDTINYKLNSIDFIITEVKHNTINCDEEMIMIIDGDIIILKSIIINSYNTTAIAVDTNNIRYYLSKQRGICRG